MIDNNSGAALSRRVGQIWDESRQAARKAAQDRGNTFIQLSQVETDRWMQASASLYDEWVADMKRRNLPGDQMLKDARDLVVKYRK